MNPLVLLIRRLQEAYPSRTGIEPPRGSRTEPRANALGTRDARTGGRRQAPRRPSLARRARPTRRRGLWAKAMSAAPFARHGNGSAPSPAAASAWAAKRDASAARSTRARCARADLAPFQPRHPLQHGTDRGSVLRAEPLLLRAPIDGFRGIEHRRGRLDPARIVANHPNVLVPDIDLHGDVAVVALDHHGRAQFEDPRIARAGADEVVDQARRQPGFHAEHHGLGAGHVVDRDEKVRDIFHLAAVAEGAHVVDAPTEGLEQRLDPPDRAWVAAGVEDEITAA